VVTTRGISVAIPTFQRESILVATIESVLEQCPEELLVVDQTAEHEPAVEATLHRLEATGRIRRLRLKHPSITHAMNTALELARQPIVLFLDDDVVPTPGLIAAHSRAYCDDGVWAVAGQVLQPGQGPEDVTATEGSDLCTSLNFPFNSTHTAWVKSAIGCNFSADRDNALRIGGFDENFLGSAYRFETDFCCRVWLAGGKVLFEPAASVRHLKFPSGGTRARGSHLTSVSPRHGVGDYYFALRQGLSLSVLAYVLRRPLREVCTRFHLRHPWWLPVKGLGEVTALLWAVGLALRGPRYVDPVSK
jgi:GT2 family glycosyltransferase